MTTRPREWEPSTRRTSHLAGLPAKVKQRRCRRRRAWKKAFPGSSPYDGRHTYASLLIHEGRSLPYVTAALGHSTAKTTLDHYAHVYAEAQLGTAVRMVDAIMEARRGVRKLCAADRPRRVRQAAPGA